jgi:hypothetical protein
LGLHIDDLVGASRLETLAAQLAIGGSDPTCVIAHREPQDGQVDVPQARGPAGAGILACGAS